MKKEIFKNQSVSFDDCYIDLYERGFISADECLKVIGSSFEEMIYDVVEKENVSIKNRFEILDL